MQYRHRLTEDGYRGNINRDWEPGLGRNAKFVLVERGGAILNHVQLSDEPQTLL